MQVQESYADVPLHVIETLGTRVYDLIPSYRDRCPLCEGAGCAVRHGLYFRGVLGTGGFVSERFPIPRFRCSRRGPRRPKAATFSVLPAALAPRRRLSVPLMLHVVGLLQEHATVPRSLDRLGATWRADGDSLFLDEVAVYRVLELFALAYLRLDRTRGAPLRPAPRTLRARAFALAETLHAAARTGGSPTQVVLAFHRRSFPALLLDSR